MYIHVCIYFLTARYVTFCKRRLLDTKTLLKQVKDLFATFNRWLTTICSTFVNATKSEDQTIQDIPEIA